MNFYQFVFQDWKVNKNNTRGRILLIFFRIANFCSARKIYFYLGLPYLFFYKFFIQWVFVLEMPWRLKVGKNLSIHHGQVLIINNKVVIGENCTLRQGTTIGIKTLKNGRASAAPVLGNNVDVGCNVCIIGDIKIDDNVKIGAGSIVTKDIPSNAIVAGNPAKIIKYTNQLITQL
jgi:putative colanic acid biosynthesis acetyltransferase WcaB